jgi:hypothetical protein
MHCGYYKDASNTSNTLKTLHTSWVVLRRLTTLLAFYYNMVTKLNNDRVIGPEAPFCTADVMWQNIKILILMSLILI